VPSIGVKRPDKAESNVDFPAPLGPRTTIRIPDNDNDDDNDKDNDNDNDDDDNSGNDDDDDNNDDDDDDDDGENIIPLVITKLQSLRIDGAGASSISLSPIAFGGQARVQPICIYEYMYIYIYMYIYMNIYI
jgi:hypothetical protein